MQIQQHKLLELFDEHKKKIGFERIFLPNTKHTGEIVYSRKIRAMHRVLFVLGRQETVAGMPV